MRHFKKVDFHHISAILLNHLKEADVSQPDYMDLVFADFILNCGTDFAFDNGLICHWIKGQAKLSPKIVEYYIDNDHREAMHFDILEQLFPCVDDVGMTVSELKELLLCDISISQYQKNQLLSYYADDEESYAAFTAELIIFGMSRRFVKSAKEQNATSPSIEDMILTTDYPKPIRTARKYGQSILEMPSLLF